MTVVVVDASVMIKWIVDEEPLDQLQACRSLIGRCSVVAPRLLDYELASILWVKHRRGDLCQDDIARISNALQLAPVRRVEDGALWIEALMLAARLNHSPYDCAYVVAGLQADAGAVITADQKFIRAFSAWRAPTVPNRPFVLAPSSFDLLSQE